jgi:hypothetical protein
MAGDLVQMVECLPSKQEALSFGATKKKNKQKKEKKKEEDAMNMHSFP